MDVRRLYLLLLLRRASQAAHLAGLEAESRKLRSTPVNLEARLACLFRSLRNVENAVLARWGRSLLSGSIIARCAAEALVLVRAGAVASLQAEELGPVERTVNEDWLRVLVNRADWCVRTAGGDPSGTILSIAKELRDGDEESG